jgi:tetratricopeptide (TPR) repeat protein
MPAYDAFISYSHAQDKPVAAALQSLVQKLGKPWYRRRALRIFRDDTSLSATPHLWPSIEQALNDSRFLVLIASTQAAASLWVDKEVAYWLDHKSVDTLLIAVTDGALTWDATANDFRWSDTTPLPPSLKGRFPTEPKWVDLTPYRADARPRDQRFMDSAADFAAAIRGVPKEDLLSQELREQKRALTLAWSAAASLLLLAVLATWQWREAVAQRDRAESTLAAATRSANNFILKVAIRVRQTVGIPIDLVREILAQAQDLQGELIKHNERDPNLQRSRAIGLRETSQTLLLQGDTEAALDQALKSRAIMDMLMAAQPHNPELRQELSLAHNRVGEALSRGGRREEALDSFERSLSIRQALAAATPDNEAKRALALSYERVGDELFNLGRREPALAAYQAALSTREQLVSSQPDKLEWQADLAVSFDRIGRSTQNKREEALAAYQKSLAIREQLVIAEARNALWQRDLASSCDNVGMIHLASGRQEQALELHRRALAIREKLAAGDAGNPQWQILLVISHVKLAEANDDPLSHYKRALPIVLQLEKDGKLSAAQRGWRSEIENRLAKLSAAGN